MNLCLDLGRLKLFDPTSGASLSGEAAPAKTAGSAAR
jgi:hypothetical protein